MKNITAYIIPNPYRTDIDWDLINRISMSQAQSFKDVPYQAEQVNEIIREHLSESAPGDP